MSALNWWDCDHKGVGLPGCPTCDGLLGGDVRMWLRQGRDEIGRLRTKLRQAEERERVWAEAASPVRVPR